MTPPLTPAALAAIRQRAERHEHPYPMDTLDLLAALDAALAERDRLAQVEQMRDAAVAYREIQSTETLRVALNEMTAQRDAALAEVQLLKTSDLYLRLHAERDAAIRERDYALRRRDVYLAKRQRTARRLRDLHAERNALSATLDREATDHAETLRQRDEARAILAALLDDPPECWNDVHKAMECLLCHGTNVGEVEDYHRRDCPTRRTAELLGGSD